MKYNKFLYHILGLLLILPSCAQPVITNLERGKYNYDDKELIKDMVEVSVALLPVEKASSEPEKPKTFFDLRDSLPHIYLKLMAEKTKTPEELIATLSKPLSVPPKQAEKQKATDYTTYKVTFSFANLKKYYNSNDFMHPNTRLEFLTTKLDIPPSSPVTIYTIDKLQNEYDDIDLGSLSRDQTVSFNAKLAADGALGISGENTNGSSSSNSLDNQSSKGTSVYDANGNVIGTVDNIGKFNSTTGKSNSSKATADAKINASVEAAYANSTAIKEAVAIKLKRIRTGFSFSDRSLSVAQRGRPLGDISDNIYVTATLKVSNPSNVVSFNVYDFDKLFDENNTANSADKILLSSRNVNFVPVDSAKDIVVGTSYEGAIRRVRNGLLKTGTNALEYDDKVTYYKIKSDSTKPKTLTIPKAVYGKRAFKIIAKDIDGKEYSLQIAAPVPEELIVFIDDNPKVLLQWLQDDISNPVASNLLSPRFRMYFEEKGSKGKNTIDIIKKTAVTGSDINAIKKIVGVSMEERTK